MTAYGRLKFVKTSRSPLLPFDMHLYKSDAYIFWQKLIGCGHFQLPRIIGSYLDHHEICRVKRLNPRAPLAGTDRKFIKLDDGYTVVSFNIL